MWERRKNKPTAPSAGTSISHFCMPCISPLPPDGSGLWQVGLCCAFFAPHFASLCRFDSRSARQTGSMQNRKQTHCRKQSTKSKTTISAAAQMLADCAAFGSSVSRCHSSWGCCIAVEIAEGVRQKKEDINTLVQQMLPLVFCEWEYT